MMQDGKRMNVTRYRTGVCNSTTSGHENIDIEQWNKIRYFYPIIIGVPFSYTQYDYAGHIQAINLSTPTCTNIEESYILRYQHGYYTVQIRSYILRYPWLLYCTQLIGKCMCACVNSLCWSQTQFCSCL